MCATGNSLEEQNRQRLPSTVDFEMVEEENRKPRLRKAADYPMRFWQRLLSEVRLVKRAWKSLLIGIAVQYLQNIGTNVIYAMHDPDAPVLKDNGFRLFGDKIPASLHWISEVAFFALFAVFVATAFSPLFLESTRIAKFECVNFARRFLIVGGLAQMLRMASYLSTVLPAPAPHCRGDSGEYAPPEDALEIIFGVNVFKGCGDLIFSSHTLLALTMSLTLARYVDLTSLKVLVWLDTAFLALTTVAFRKHYTVDVVVACYTVPLLFIACEKWFPDIPQGENATKNSEDLELGERSEQLNVCSQNHM